MITLNGSTPLLAILARRMNNNIYICSHYHRVSTTTRFFHIKMKIDDWHLGRFTNVLFKKRFTNVFFLKCTNLRQILFVYILLHLNLQQQFQHEKFCSATTPIKN